MATVDGAVFVRNTFELSTTSRLLQLPRELRDIIYEYAFTADGGLAADTYCPRYHNTLFRAANEDKSGGRYDTSRLHNQLRFVYRQLRVETSGLGLRFNDLIFRAHNPKIVGDAARVAIAGFLDHCLPTYLEDVRKVKIIYGGSISSRSIIDSFQQHFLPSLVVFCRQYPKAHVIVRFDWEGELLARNMVVYSGLRILTWNNKPFASIADTVRGSAAGMQCPDNLRISCLREFNDESARYDAFCFIYSWPDDFDRSPATNNPSTWVAFGRRFHDDGAIEDT